jgi:hypothetical protein
VFPELREELRRLTPVGRVEAAPLPPLGPGILKRPQQNNSNVTITVSSQVAGTVACLLTEVSSEWYVLFAPGK